MSAIVKRTIRLRSLNKRNEPIITPADMFRVASEELTSPRLEFLYVTRDDTDYFREALKPSYAKMKKLKGTRQRLVRVKRLSLSDLDIPKTLKRITSLSHLCWKMLRTWKLKKTIKILCQ